MSTALPPYYGDSLRFASGFTGSYRMTGAIGRVLNWRHGYPITMFVRRSGSDPELLTSGAVDFEWFVPAYVADWARRGVGEFAGRPAPNARAIATLPQADLMLFAVSPRCDIGSLEEIGQRRLPLRIGIRGATFFVLELLRNCGAPAEQIEAWGGRVLRGREELGTSQQVGRWCAESGLDAVFGEAATQPIWRALAAEGWRFLPVSEALLKGMEAALEIRRAVIPAGFLPVIAQPLPTIDQSNFQLVCRAELPDEVAHLVARVIDENREAIQNATVGVSLQYTQALPIRQLDIASPLTGPIERQWEGCSIPLHPGAERYYREKGYLDGADGAGRMPQ